MKHSLVINLIYAEGGEGEVLNAQMLYGNEEITLPADQAVILAPAFIQACDDYDDAVENAGELFNKITDTLRGEDA